MGGGFSEEVWLGAGLACTALTLCSHGGVAENVPKADSLACLYCSFSGSSPPLWLELERSWPFLGTVQGRVELGVDLMWIFVEYTYLVPTHVYVQLSAGVPTLLLPWCGDRKGTAQGWLPMYVGGRVKAPSRGYGD